MNIYSMKTNEDSLTLYYSSFKKAVNAGNYMLINHGHKVTGMDKGKYSTLIHSSSDTYIIIDKLTVY